ncbi:unnamed protein product [Sordaria macrospora k-hell]|uniref:WGS project CABT00000000 data, contig 2.6 n=1 Tax=Sordaria macrospora (strain ATCC MYA-333 / DSM 997 / K(L3346) / K-hell) TaxID=771870 RepID=F7VT14_SORMK|nr:uncharacterized protein SMAC_05473 [Sordaria macrospora k-hell]CCC08832.1 unnamed protein product [Sordaria macrospora k-hell]
MATYPRQIEWTHGVSRMSLEAANVGLNDASTNEEEEEGGEGNGHPCDNDDDEGMLGGEGYLRQKKRKFEDKNNHYSNGNGNVNVNDETAAAPDHASAGDSSKDNCTWGISTPFYSGGGGSSDCRTNKLKRNNSNSAELMLQGVSSRSPTPFSQRSTPQNSSETSFGYGFGGHGGYFQSCEDCFVDGLRCGHLTTAATATIIMPDGRGGLIRNGGNGNGNGKDRAAHERHEWLVERMKESLAKIDCAAGGGSAVGSRKSA